MPTNRRLLHIMSREKLSMCVGSQQHCHHLESSGPVAVNSNGGKAEKTRLMANKAGASKLSMRGLIAVFASSVTMALMKLQLKAQNCKHTTYSLGARRVARVHLG